jgi:hypothetical protein
MFNNNYNEDFFVPRGYENFLSHQEMVSHRRSNRVLFENNGYGRPCEFCTSCMSKPPDKQVVFPVYDDVPQYLQSQPPKSTSPLLPYVNDEQTPLQLIEQKESTHLHYPRYMYNNELPQQQQQQNVYYNDYPEVGNVNGVGCGLGGDRYGMNHFIDRDCERRSQHYYSVVNSNPTPRARVMSMEYLPYSGSLSRNSNDYRFMRNSQEYHHMSLEKNQIPKNEIDDITKDSMEWKTNTDVKIEKEPIEETNTTENNYEGLMDIKKTIKKDYNKKKWRKMTQELFNQILDFEKKNPNIKQCEIEKIFLVNRSTYWRWKKRLLS